MQDSADLFRVLEKYQIGEIVELTLMQVLNTLMQILNTLTQVLNTVLVLLVQSGLRYACVGVKQQKRRTCNILATSLCLLLGADAALLYLVGSLTGR